MNTDFIIEKNTNFAQKPKWNAVYAVAVSVAGLIMSEFLPAILITPMARDLNITEGLAGQAISVTAVTGLIASLFISYLTNGMDRRMLVLFFTILQISSNLLVYWTTNFYMLVIAGFILGIGIGGFWSMSLSLAMRLVPEKNVPKALSIIFGGESIAIVITAPLGSILGHYLGWRNVFLLTALVGLIALIWQLIKLPNLPDDKPIKLQTFIRILKRPKMIVGMFAVLVLFIGNAVYYTYLRPFLEKITGVSIHQLSLILLFFSLANLLATTLAGYILKRFNKIVLVYAPLLFSASLFMITFFSQDIIFVAILLVIFSFFFSLAEFGWSTFVTKIAPDEGEAGGSIFIATIQFGISIGASFGGIIYDLTNPTVVFFCSSLIFIIAFIPAFLTFKKLKTKN